MDKDRGWAIAAGVLMVAIYTSQLVAARYSLKTTLTAWDLSFLRFIGAGLCFLPGLTETNLRLATTIGWGRLLVLAFLAGLPYILVINWGVSLSSASHAAVIGPGCIVLMSFILTPFFNLQEITQTSMSKRIILAFGLVCFIAPSVSSNPNLLRGDLLFVLQGAMFATFGILVRLWRIPPLFAAGSVLLISSLFSLLLPVFGVTGLAGASLLELGAQVLIQGVFSGALALYLFLFVGRHLGSGVAARFMGLIPISTLVFAGILLHETPTALEIVAMGLIVFALTAPASS